MGDTGALLLAKGGKIIYPSPEPRTPNPEPRTPNPEPRTPNPLELGSWNLELNIPEPVNLQSIICHLSSAIGQLTNRQSCYRIYV
jgi:hypothetical protein